MMSYFQQSMTDKIKSMYLKNFLNFFSRLVDLYCQCTSKFLPILWTNLLILCVMNCFKQFSYFQSLSHLVQDAKFKSRLDRFVDVNVIRNPNDRSRTCRLCHSKLVHNVKKHFVFKHLKIVEPSIKSNFTIWLTLSQIFFFFLQISTL